MVHLYIYICDTLSLDNPKIPHTALPYITFGRKPKLLLDLEPNPDIIVSATYKEYYEQLEKRLRYLQKVLQDFKTR